MTTRPRRSPRKAPQSEQLKSDACPACKDAREHDDSELWVRCDSCRDWYHWLCVGQDEDLDAVDKWYCKPCSEANPSHVITLKPPARKSSRKRTQLDYANLHEGIAADPKRWMSWTSTKPIKDESFRRMHGAEVGLEWLMSDDKAMTEPVIIPDSEGLGMKMPQTCTINDIVEMIGQESPVEVIDVATQRLSPNWTLSKWGEYYNTSPGDRDKIRNVISLEISNSKLSEKILPPRLVREIDWVEKFWPQSKRGGANVYPKVQLYCLMGVADAWTDWHVDFAGSSVYYHIFRGEKIFFFIRPTPANLSAYEKWSGSAAQSTTWLGDLADEVYKVHLYEGNTMIIPTGWIHAVATPKDALVFGGNFLHSFNIDTQLRIVEMELKLGVARKFRFPLFQKLCWFVGEKYLRDFKAKEEFIPRVLEGVVALANYLVNEARTMERGQENNRREAKEQVPERIKDPAALARELRWRAQHAFGAMSDDEGKKTRNAVNGIRKRKRDGSPGHFKNFIPKKWDKELREVIEDQKQVRQGEKRADLEEWMQELEGRVGDEDAEWEKKKDVVTKVRRWEEDGRVIVEKQRVERSIERWIF